MAVRIRLLGRLVVERDDGPSADDWSRRKSAALVALLALAPNRRLHREQVIDALWPDASVVDAAPRLHKAAHHARRALGKSDAIVARNEVVALLPDDDVRVDALEFATAAEHALALGTVESADAALECYGGDLLPELLYEEWSDEPRTRLRLLHLQLLYQAQRWDDILEREPTDEQAHIALMQRLFDSGAHRAALLQFDQLRDVVERELGAEPSAAAVELRDRILAASEAMAAAPRAPSDGGAHDHSRPRRLGHFPQPSDSFLGREADLTALDAAWSRSRVVTLFGPGGVGKTRLAVEFARSAPIDCVFVDLSAVGADDSVAGAVLDALGASARAGMADVDRLVETLAARPLMVVLDNCEHVVEEVAAVSSRMAHDSPDVRILVTSREALGIPGESVVPVDPLGLPTDTAPLREQITAEAVQLFCDRAERAGGVVDDLRAVVTLVRRLDGIPLALELAAARSRAFSPAQIVAQLDEGSTVTATRRSPGPGHHGSLEETIDWSFRLLDDDERSLLSHLSVFHGAFDLRAATAVVDVVPMRAADLLTRLVDKSLVQSRVGRAGRRLGLLDTVRRFAAARLDEDAAAVARQRHMAHFADHVAALGVEVPGPDEDHALAQLAVEFDDAFAAFEHAVEQGDIDAAARVADGPRLALTSEGALWTRLALRAVDLPGIADHPRYVSIAASAAWGAVLRGDLERSRRIASKALDVAGDPAHHPRLCWIWPQAMGESFDVGVDACIQGAQVANARDDAGAESFLLATAAIYRLVLGQVRRSAEAAEQALELAHMVGSRSLTARAAGALAYALQDVDVTGARRAAAEVIRVAAPGDFHLNMPHRVLAWLAWREGDAAAAGAHAAEAGRLIRDQGDRYVQAAAMRQLAVMVGDVDAPLAAKLLGVADSIIPGIPVIERDAMAVDRLRSQLVDALGADELGSLVAHGRATLPRDAYALAQQGIAAIRAASSAAPAPLNPSSA